ncbi:MAG: class I SAM-dependent methyltransferase [Candidatus Zhuqueibacterota bacterium]
MNTQDNKKCYEIADNWDTFRMDEHLQSKIDLIEAMIPSDVTSILDVGCGNGLITNPLGRRFAIRGLDRSFAALQYVDVPKINGQADALPLSSSSVDLILSSEMLEHLDDSLLRAAIQEMQRVASKYLIISVPNNELLAKNAMKCPRCSTVFNVSYHFQSYTRQRLEKLFSEFHCLKIAEVGKPWRRYIPFLLKIRQELGHGWFPIPPRRIVMCPNCENTQFPKFKMNPIIFLCEGMNKLLTRRRPNWLVALYQRKSRM